MRQNPTRRAALLDAAIEVLAREGARGLTFRAVDTQAGVPNGTASNYFASRAELLAQTGAHVHLRLTPTDEYLATMLAEPPSKDVVRRAMRDLFARVSEDRTGYLALLELRLESTRRPEVRAALTETVGRNIQDNINFHLDQGFPGDRETVVALYLAMTGLIVEHLTLPEAWRWTDFPTLIDELVARIVPDH